MDNEVDPTDEMTDEEFAGYAKALLEEAEAQAEARGITAEELQTLRDSLAQWQRSRIQSAIAEEKVTISKAKLDEAGRNYLQALEDHMPDDELPN